MVSDRTAYSLEQLTESSTWLMMLRGKFDLVGVRNTFHTASLQMQASASAKRLIVDLNPTIFESNANIQTLLETLLEALLNANLAASLQYALLSENPVVTGYVRQLEAQGLELPVFKRLADALTFFNLKESSKRLKQSMEHTHTQDVRFVDLSSVEVLDEDPATPQRGTNTFPENGLLKLTALEGADSMLLSPETETVVGRRSMSGLQPHIDLSLWGAYEKGVSRRHAKLLLNSDGQLCLVELGSANGTFLNGKQLQPFQQYVLHEFDTIRLGQLSFRITYQKVTK